MRDVDGHPMYRKSALYLGIDWPDCFLIDWYSFIKGGLIFSFLTHQSLATNSGGRVVVHCTR